MSQQVALVILHPTSSLLILFSRCFHTDPYNRRLIWTIIRKMKDAGKCIILTTHFLEEADVLSDRIAIMTSGRLQACGTPDYLKSQIGTLLLIYFVFFSLMFLALIRCRV